MKALKALVIGMGLLLVVGLGLVGYGLMRNLPQKSAAQPFAAGASSAGGQGYFAVELPLAAGNHLEQMAVSGDKVLLRFSGSDGDRIVVLDPQTGHLAGTITLIPQKP